MKLSERIATGMKFVQFVFDAQARERELKMTQLAAFAGDDYDKALWLINDQDVHIDWVTECTKEGMLPYVYDHFSYMMTLSHENITSFEMLYRVAKQTYIDASNYPKYRTQAESIAIVERFAVLTVYGYSQIFLFEHVVNGDDLILLFDFVTAKSVDSDLLKQVSEMYYKD